jgi:hypothetical protein
MGVLALGKETGSLYICFFAPFDITRTAPKSVPLDLNRGLWSGPTGGKHMIKRFGEKKALGIT